MRIGEFANTNKITTDTIRHYMELGLLIPEKNGGQYSFDSKSQKDLDDILELKKMGFTLNEVKTFFMFRSLGKLTPYQEDEYYKALFINKLKKITDEINQLMEIKNKLNLKIEEISSYANEVNYQFGIDLKTINLFKCLKCNGDMILYDGNITNNQIINGSLRCTCGEEYKIESGILMVDYENNKNSSVKFEDDYIRDYIDLTNSKYLDKIYKGLEWVYKKIDFKIFSQKVILDLGSGVGFLLRYIYNDLPKDSIYIAVDNDIERHKFLKRMLEKIEYKKTIIFICSDFLQIPIKDKSVDVLLDISGTSNYSFNDDRFLLELIDNLAKDEAYLLGTYILFKNFSLNTLISERYRKNFILKNVQNEISQLKYKLMDDKILEYIDEGGQYESYFVKGEKVYSYLFYGKRLG